MKKGGNFTDYSILGRSPLFRGIPAGDFGVLLEHLKAETRSYKKGDLICHAGEHTNALGIVLTGSVTIESDDIFGNRSVLDKVGPGQVFAETYACVPNEPMLVNVAAAENCTVLFLKTAQILSPCPVNCRHHGKLIENLLLVSAQKNLSLSRRIFHTAPKTIRGRLISYLSFQAIRESSDSFTIPFNRQQLADYLSVDRSALSKEMGKMRDEGILNFSKNHFELKRTS